MQHDPPALLRLALRERPSHRAALACDKARDFLGRLMEKRQPPRGYYNTIFLDWHALMCSNRELQQQKIRPYMDLQSRRDLQLLSEVEKDGYVTQRTLAKSLGVALGLANLCVKRLARKGYIKITTIPRNRIKYLLTPHGVAEKSRLTYQYMQYSLYYYRQMRDRLKQVLSGLSNAGCKRLVIYGTGELAELAYLTLREMDLALVGFVNGKDEGTFLSYPLLPVVALPTCDFDALLITDLENTDNARASIVQGGVPSEKVVTLAPGG
jgi:DNA-binding MarR family transcriptional regulator